MVQGFQKMVCMLLRCLKCILKWASWNAQMLLRNLTSEKFSASKSEGVSFLKSKCSYCWKITKQNGTFSLHLKDIFIFISHCPSLVKVSEAKVIGKGRKEELRTKDSAWYKLFGLLSWSHCSAISHFPRNSLMEWDR